MHEFGIVHELIDLADRELDRMGYSGEVSAFTVKVGMLSGASPEAMETAFELLVPSTRFAKAKLEILEIRPVCRCNTCHSDTEIESFTLTCPICGGRDISLEGGRDLQLASLDIED